jgi:hypothetical protein
VVVVGVVAAAAAFVLMGGEKQTTSTGAPTERVAQAGTTPVSTLPPAATVAPTQRAGATNSLVIAKVTPAALSLPRLQGEELGSNNVAAAAQLRQAIAAVIPDMNGVQVSVHRWLDKQESVLVVDMDEAAAKRFPSDTTPVIKAITDSPATKRYNITELAMFMAGRDNQGTYTITASMSLTTATALAGNKLSQQQIKEQVQASMTRP